MRIRLARKEGERVAEEFGFREPPVDVKKIARRLGLQVIETDLDPSVSGLLISRQENASIILNEAHSPNRKRFTIAHEIGHHVLRHQFEHGEHVHVDRGHVVSLRGARASEGVDPKEIEANQFAAALLMPSGFLQAEVGALDVDVLRDHHVEQLAWQFKVSEQAMTIRLTAIGVL